jgi:hypothetical protein
MNQIVTASLMRLCKCDQAERLVAAAGSQNRP